MIAKSYAALAEKGRAFTVALASLFLMGFCATIAAGLVIYKGDLDPEFTKVVFYVAGVAGAAITALGGTNVVERWKGNPEDSDSQH